jgi:hypothetical protein
MKITFGPKLSRFSEVFGWTRDEVLLWVNGYVNSPEENFIGVFERTEQERLAAIGAYIDWRIESSTHGRFALDYGGNHLQQMRDTESAGLWLHHDYTQRYCAACKSKQPIKGGGYIGKVFVCAGGKP